MIMLWQQVLLWKSIRNMQTSYTTIWLTLVDSRNCWTYAAIPVQEGYSGCDIGNTSIIHQHCSLVVHNHTAWHIDRCSHWYNLQRECLWHDWQAGQLSYMHIEFMMMVWNVPERRNSRLFNSCGCYMMEKEPLIKKQKPEIKNSFTTLSIASTRNRSVKIL
jgi:hypothetical protein